MISAAVRLSPALVLAACGGGDLADRQVDALGNVLVYSATARSGYTGTDHAGFTPTTPRAWVTWEQTSVGAGSVGLQIFDGRGIAVYGESANANGTPAGKATQLGEAGNWRVVVKYEKAAGTVNFRIEGATGGAP